MDDFGTRLVLQARDEEESVALIGMPVAEELGSGGHALLRFESRVPVRGWARQVPAEPLARFASLMGARAASPPADDATPIAEVHPNRDDDRPEQAQVDEELPIFNELVPVADRRSEHSREVAARPPGAEASPLLTRLRAAPIRVRCFGATSVWHGAQQLQIGDSELLLLLAAHPISGIRNEAVADMLCEQEVSDPSAALRKRGYRLRDLRRAVPDLDGPSQRT